MHDVGRNRRGTKHRESYSREAWAKAETRAAIAFHITMRLASARGIVRSQAALRLGSWIVFRQGRKRGLLAFRFADTHLHVIVVGDRELAGKAARYIEASLRKRLRILVPFERARIRPIDDERHLLNALRYVLLQEEHHGTELDLTHDGSSLPELLGMRTDGAWLVARTREALPRLTRETVLGWLDLPDLEECAHDADLVADAAAAAYLVADLSGTTAAHVRARRAAVHVLDRVAPGSKTEELLGIRPRAAARYRREAVPEADIRAVELQLRLRTLLRRRAAETSTVATLVQ